MSERNEWKGVDAFQEALLRSSVLDEPDAGALGRAALALGVTVTSLGVTSSAAAAAACANAAAASGAATAVKTGFGAALWVKPLMVGAALGAVTTTSVEVLLERQAARETRASADFVERREPARREDLTRAAAVPRGVPAPEPEPGPALAQRPPVARFEAEPEAANVARAGEKQPSPAARSVVLEPAPTTSVRVAERAGSISEQIDVIDRARAALRSRDPEAALAQLDGYRLRWPRGELSIEATVLRIEARFATGNHAAARAEAREFIDAQPTSRYAARLRQLLASEINSSGR